MVLVQITGALLIAAAITFGNAAGVGGAGIIVPVLLLMYSLEMLQASALSNFLIFIGFALRYYFNYKERHPKKNKPVIDYDTASIMLPASLFGTKFGVIVHDMFPRPALFLLLSVTLLYLSYCSYMRGNKLAESELQQRLKPVSKAAPMISLERMSDDEFVPAGRVSVLEKQRIFEIEEQEARPLPPKKAFLILVLFACMMISIIIEGSKGLPSLVGIGLCSTGYWLSFILFIMICVVIVAINAHDINALATEKRLLGIKLTADDVDWTWPKIVQYSAYGVFAGILSAIFGIGGGMILSPVLVQLGMEPEVVSATGGLFVLFTTASSTAILMYEGHWIVSYGLILGTVSILSSVLSIWVVSGLIKKYGRPSIIVYIMAVVIAVSAVVLTSAGFYQDYVEYGTIFSAAAWSFHNFCKAK
eukprot:TRINITY_DN10416_c0_g1_i8.p1 TRINITY_DN10416_c0_g1~~TRINITY_DN10416_c0_g1_i8.p1  ORF type:complete len:418 (-),score=83.79 TRINITY_DN10416_c0_g1_i8:136-1389(-)